MTTDPKKPGLVSGADKPVTADELSTTSRKEEAQDANEAMRDAETKEGATIPDLRQSDIRGSAD